MLFQTSSEVLLDEVLALLLWEDKVPPVAAAVDFKEGQVAKRLKSMLEPRLGGQRATKTPGPVGSWHKQCVKLRNRVVHGGCRPSRGEADSAYEALLGLERHVMDRLVDKRTVYKRSTLLTVAESGLRRRGKRSGQIKTFAETVADTEPNWLGDFRDWHDQFIAAIT